MPHTDAHARASSRVLSWAERPHVLPRAVCPGVRAQTLTPTRRVSDSELVVRFFDESQKTIEAIESEAPDPLSIPEVSPRVWFSIGLILLLTLGHSEMLEASMKAW